MDEVAYVRFASVYRQFKDVNTFMEEIKNLKEGVVKSKEVKNKCGIEKGDRHPFLMFSSKVHY